MDIKPQPNRKLYIRILRRMSPEQRLLKAFELTEISRTLLLQGLRTRFPERSEREIRKIYLERLNKCHNRNW